MTTKEIIIGGEKFTISAPYAAGHVVTDAEARVLNQTRGENIGNNFRKRVDEAMKKADGERPAALDAVREAIGEYDSKYNFAMGGGLRIPMDPVEREALLIARDSVKAQIREKKGLSVKQYLEIEGNQEKYDAAVEKIATSDDVLKLAKRRVADKKKAVDGGEDLGL